jgi:hypothetical protein
VPSAHRVTQQSRSSEYCCQRDCKADDEGGQNARDMLIIVHCELCLFMACARRAIKASGSQAYLYRDGKEDRLILAERQYNRQRQTSWQFRVICAAAEKSTCRGSSTVQALRAPS